jgi:hypothetical protein
MTIVIFRQANSDFNSTESQNQKSIEDADESNDLAEQTC